MAQARPGTRPQRAGNLRDVRDPEQRHADRRLRAVLRRFLHRLDDLTQLTLGVDRDSEIVAFDYDERDDGVKAMIRLAIEGCRRNRRHSGFCGQAPSDYPDMAQFLVELGIDSISLNPDAVVRTTLTVLDVERRLGRVRAAPASRAEPPRDATTSRVRLLGSMDDAVVAQRR